MIQTLIVAIDLHDPDLLEALAEYHHILWSDWEKWRHEHALPISEARWLRQRNTDYADLTPQEQESDRDVARRTLKAIQAFAAGHPHPARPPAPAQEGLAPGQFLVRSAPDCSSLDTWPY